MFIYIVRHAWAGEHDRDRWPDDRLRPLTSQGIVRFKQMARAVVKRSFEPAAIATSPLVRCRQTADILLDSMPKPIPLTELEALAPGSDLKALMSWTRQQGNVDVAWVGHAPDVDELTAALIGDSSATIHFAKGAIAAIRFDNPSAGHGELDYLLTAKMLGL